MSACLRVKTAWEQSGRYQVAYASVHLATVRYLLLFEAMLRQGRLSYGEIRDRETGRLQVLTYATLLWQLLRSLIEGALDGLVRQLGRRVINKVSSGSRSPISHLRSPISDLPSPISHLRSPISDLPSAISHLRSPISDLPSPISHLRSPISDLPSPISHLRSPISDPPSPIPHLRSPISDPPSPIPHLRSPISDLRTLCASVVDHPR